jgi:hypothetical protein
VQPPGKRPLAIRAEPPHRLAMTTDWRRHRLPLLIDSLASRPGHEAVRTALAEILGQAFGAAPGQVTHELRMPVISGRADALFGAAVFEFKKNLDKERGDVERRLPDYLREQERQWERPFVGIATDGAMWEAFELRGAAMVSLGRARAEPDRPEALLAWLEPALSERDDLPADAATIARELGRDSLAFRRAEGRLSELWGGLKRDLWDGLLREAYGAEVGEETLERLKALYRAQRNGIWPYVMRNLVRPLWLSRPANRADVLIGNPAWVAYRHLSAPLQERLRDACKPMGLWVGGHLATQQDIAALFVARGAERYLKPGGVVAQVLPYAVLNRPAFGGLRAGACGTVQLRWDRAWSFDEQVQPLFPVPAAVLFGRRAAAGRLPRQVLRFAGRLPRRDATEAEAAPLLAARRAPWPPIPTLAGASPYRARFAQGATVVPRRFFLVDRVVGGRLASAAAPRVRGRTGGQDKAPWKHLDPPEGPVEVAWLRPVVLGASLAPFRLLSTSLAVLAVDGKGRAITEGQARIEGAPGLADWLGRTGALWAANAAKGRDGAPKMTLWQQLDYRRKLTGQFPVPPLRVVYAASGTLMAACTVSDARAVVEHQAYWAPARDEEEARYLCAVLNADSLRDRIAAMQSKGQGGARHFDNLFWELPIPEFSRRDARHRALAALGARAEQVAAAVALDGAAHFTRQSRAIRDALLAEGVQAELDAAALALIGG